MLLEVVGTSMHYYIILALVSYICLLRLLSAAREGRTIVLEP